MALSMDPFLAQQSVDRPAPSVDGFGVAMGQVLHMSVCTWGQTELYVWLL